MLIAVAEKDAVAQRNAAIFSPRLQELGWTEGRNLKIELRWPAGDIVRSRDYAVELVGLGPDLIVAVGTPSVAALKQATHSVPIVFAIVNDPSRPGLHCEHGASRWQYHRLLLPRVLDGRKVAGNAQTDDAQ